MVLRMSRFEILPTVLSHLEYPPERIPEMVEKIRRDEADIVVARRISEKRSFIKKSLSFFYRVILRALFGRNFLDPQSGLKALRREVIEQIWPVESDGFEIDAEILIKASKKGFSIIYVLIEYTHRGTSRVSVIKDPIRMLLSLIKWRLYG